VVISLIYTNTVRQLSYEFLNHETHETVRQLGYVFFDHSFFSCLFMLFMVKIQPKSTLSTQSYLHRFFAQRRAAGLSPNKMARFCNLRFLFIRRTALLAALFAALFCCAPQVFAQSRVRVDSKHWSPKNRQRPVRKSTQYIILHTTEGGARGALEKLSRNGECHYVVDTDGKIYSIIDKRRVAYHVGLSMWKGRTGLDAFSIGIEIVGYHNKPITSSQFQSVRSLLFELKRTYRIPDDNVLTHSMVAYGNPNRWQKKRHRGRKRCGMLLALPESRAKLGLRSKPSFDPDVRAGRLVDADPELSRMLYMKAPVVSDVALMAQRSDSNVIGPGRTAWDIARDLYRSKETVYIFPDGTRRTGAEITNWKAMQSGTRVEIGGITENATEGILTIGVDGTVQDLAGDEMTAHSTIYFSSKNTAQYRHGSSLTLAEIDGLPKGTKMLVGYSIGGPVSSRLPVFNICSVKWNRPDTFYLDPCGKLISGDQVNEKNIKAGSMVFYRP